MARLDAPSLSRHGSAEDNFDVEANGILNEPAQDNTTGSSNQITIANVKRRLSQPATDRMMLAAEKNRAEHNSNKQKVGTNNGLENYCFSSGHMVHGPIGKGKGAFPQCGSCRSRQPVSSPAFCVRCGRPSNCSATI